MLVQVDVHLMPDLPGSNPEMDRKMLGDALFDPDLDADYYKVVIPSLPPSKPFCSIYLEAHFHPPVHPLSSVSAAAWRMRGDHVASRFGQASCFLTPYVVACPRSLPHKFGVFFVHRLAEHGSEPNL